MIIGRLDCTNDLRGHTCRTRRVSSSFKLLLRFLNLGRGDITVAYTTDEEMKGTIETEGHVQTAWSCVRTLMDFQDKKN